MKKLLLFIIICISVSCGNQGDFKEKIKGNWHSKIEYDPIGQVNSIDINNQFHYRYTEYFFSDQYVYMYTDLTAALPPQEYRIMGDSIFFYYEINEPSSFEGKISMDNDSILKVTVNEHSILLYRLEESDKTLNNFVIADSLKEMNRFKSNMDSFGALFYKRFNQKFEEYNKKNN